MSSREARVAEALERVKRCELSLKEAAAICGLVTSRRDECTNNNRGP